MVGVYVSVLGALYLVPLGVFSPCIMEEGRLGPAPALIGHRGAPMVRNNQTWATTTQNNHANECGRVEKVRLIRFTADPFLGS